MAIQFQCSGCGVQFNVGENLAGTMARCNSCGNVVQVPSAAPRKNAPPVVAPKPKLPEARIEQPTASSLPVARVEVPGAATSGPAPAPAVPGLRKRPVYQLPSQKPNSGSSGGSSSGMWIAIGGGIALLVLVGAGVAGTLAVQSLWKNETEVAVNPLPQVEPPPAETPPSKSESFQADSTNHFPGAATKIPNIEPPPAPPGLQPSSTSSSSSPTRNTETPSSTSPLPSSESPSSSLPEPPPSVPSVPSAGSSGGLPSIPSRAKAAVKGTSSPAVMVESILPKSDIESSESKSGRKEEAPPRVERPWTAKADPPPQPIEYKKGKIAVTFPKYAEGKAANGPSNFLMLYNRENGTEVRAVVDLRSGAFIGKPIEGKIELAYHSEVFSPDGRYFAARSSSARDTKVGVWSFATGKPEREFELSSEYKDLEFAFAGTHQLVTAVHQTYDSVEIAVRDIKTGKTIKDWKLSQPPGDRLSRRSLLTSPGGKYLLFVMGKRLVVVDIASGEGVGEVLLEENPYELSGAAFSPDGLLFAFLYRSSGRERLVVVEFPTGKVLLDHPYETSFEYFHYDGPVLEWVPDKSLLVYKGHLLLDPQTGEDIWTFPKTDALPRRIMRPGEILVARSGKNGRVYETVSIPAAEITKAIDVVRSGGTAVDSILPAVTTPDMFSASKVTLPNGFVQWSADPDAAPAAPKGIDGEILVAKEGETLQSIILTGSKGAKVVLQKEITPRSGASGGKRDQKRVIIERIDLVSGAHSPAVDVPYFYRTVDVSPSGNFAVAGYSDRKTKTDRIDIIGLSPKKHIAGFRPYSGEIEDKSIPAYEREGQFMIKWVGMLDDEHVLTINSLGKLIVWKLPDCKAVYYFEKFGDPLAISPNRKYLAGVHDGQFRIFDAKTGNCLGDLESPSCGVKPLRAVFRPDGRELSAIINAGEDRMLVRWNLLTGKIDQEFPIPPELTSLFILRTFGEDRSLEYRGNDHLLLDKQYLIDLKKRLVIWRYSVDFGTKFVAGSPDSKTWYCMRKPNSPYGGPLFLTAIETPSPAVVRKSSGAQLEKSLLVYPGRSVRLHIDLSSVGLTHLQPSVEKAVRQSLEARGIIVDSSAPLLFSVVAGAGATGDVIGVVSGSSPFPWHRGNERLEAVISEQIMVCKIAVSDASSVKWSRENSVKMRSSGSVKTDNAQAELEKEMYDQFMRMMESGVAATSGIPTYIFYPFEETLPGESLLIFGGETSVSKAPAAGTGNSLPGGFSIP